MDLATDKVGINGLVINSNNKNLKGLLGKVVKPNGFQSLTNKINNDYRYTKDEPNNKNRDNITGVEIYENIGEYYNSGDYDFNCLSVYPVYKNEIISPTYTYLPQKIDIYQGETRDNYVLGFLFNPNDDTISMIKESGSDPMSTDENINLKPGLDPSGMAKINTYNSTYKKQKITDSQKNIKFFCENRLNAINRNIEIIQKAIEDKNITKVNEELDKDNHLDTSICSNLMVEDSSELKDCIEDGYDGIIVLNKDQLNFNKQYDVKNQNILSVRTAFNKKTKKYFCPYNELTVQTYRKESEEYPKIFSIIDQDGRKKEDKFIMNPLKIMGLFIDGRKEMTTMENGYDIKELQDNIISFKASSGKNKPLILIEKDNNIKEVTLLEMMEYFEKTYPDRSYTKSEIITRINRRFKLTKQHIDNFAKTINSNSIKNNQEIVNLILQKYNNRIIVVNRKPYKINYQENIKNNSITFNLEPIKKDSESVKQKDNNKLILTFNITQNKNKNNKLFYYLGYHYLGKNKIQNKKQNLNIKIKNFIFPLFSQDNNNKKKINRPLEKHKKNQKSYYLYLKFSCYKKNKQKLKKKTTNTYKIQKAKNNQLKNKLNKLFATRRIDSKFKNKDIII